MHLILKNILHYWKSHLLVALALALASSVIIASLLVGDSLQQTLADKALNRIGKVEGVVSKTGGTFSSDIAGEGTSAVLALDAIATSNSQSRAVKLYVVDNEFWKLSLTGKQQNLAGGIAINESFKKAFNLEKSSQVALRFAIKDKASAEIALSDFEPEIASASFSVSNTLSPKDFGDFYLYDWQNTPLNVFMSYETFCEKFKVGESANLFLSKSKDVAMNSTFESLGLFYKALVDSYIVQSKEIFIAEEILNQIPDSQKTLAWFISKIDYENGEDFNAFIVGAGSDLGENEVEINEVYAQTHFLKAGDSLNLSYYVFDEKLNLKTAELELKVAKISPINTGYFIQEIVPEYKGLTDVDDCTQWKSSIPIDLKKIKEEDKVYWEKYGASPKMRVSYEVAKKHFIRDASEATALILNYNPLSLDFGETKLEKLGFFTSNPSLDSLENAMNGVDFKPLFLGLSFFVIFNAMLLIALLLRLNLTSRFEEVRLLKYLGFKRKFIENLYLKEFFCSIVLGACFGVLLGFIFAKILVMLLNSVWGDVSASAEILFSSKVSSVFLGLCVSVFLGFLILKIFVLKFFSQNKPQRLGCFASGVFKILLLGLAFLSLVFCGVFLDIGLGLKALFSLGAYVFGVYFFIAFFRQKSSSTKGFSSWSFVRVGIVSRLSKSEFWLLSMGVYLLCVVGLNKIDTRHNLSEYNYVVKTFVGAKPPDTQCFSFMSLRLKEGAQANCLNLNKVSSPQVLGADIDALIENRVIKVKSEFQGFRDGVICAYVDESSLIWSLKANLGDDFEYDTKDGKAKLRIVGALEPSIFQGSFIIDEGDFKTLWGANAYNIFLARPNEGKGEVELSKLFAPYLPDVDTVESIMDGFDSLQNAYLKIFYQLGLLGLFLGVFGSLIAIRNRLIAEQSSLFMLNKLGLRRARISILISFQYLIINLTASLLGVISSFPLIRIADNYLKALLILVIIISLSLLMIVIIARFLKFPK